MRARVDNGRKTEAAAGASVNFAHAADLKSAAPAIVVWALARSVVTVDA